MINNPFLLQKVAGTMSHKPSGYSVLELTQLFHGEVLLDLSGQMMSRHRTLLQHLTGLYMFHRVPHMPSWIWVAPEVWDL